MYIAQQFGIEYDSWTYRFLDGKDLKFWPFYNDIGYLYDYKERVFDVDVGMLYDPFSEKNESRIRYSKSCLDRITACLISNGPDGDVDIDEKDIFGISLFEKYTPRDNDSIYDPTNGIMSNGDIFLYYHNGWNKNDIPALKILSKKDLERRIKLKNMKQDMKDKGEKVKKKIGL